jgi:hypothetical protein
MNPFKRKQKKRLSELSQDELRLRKARLQAEEQHRLRQLQSMADEKDQLIREIKRETSPAIRQVKAHKVLGIEDRTKLYQASVFRVGESIEVMELIIVHRELGQDSPYAQIVDELNELDIESDILDTTAREEATSEKLNSIIETFHSTQESRVSASATRVDELLARIDMEAAAEAIDSELEFSHDLSIDPRSSEGEEE